MAWLRPAATPGLDRAARHEPRHRNRVGAVARPTRTRAGVAQGQPPFALYVVHVVALAAIFTWLYARTDASPLLATLLHASMQGSGAFLPVAGTAAYPATVAITVATACALLWSTAAPGARDARWDVSADRR
jgi:hypothetical protein